MYFHDSAENMLQCVKMCPTKAQSNTVNS